MSVQELRFFGGEDGVKKNLEIFKIHLRPAHYSKIKKPKGETVWNKEKEDA